MAISVKDVSNVREELSFPSASDHLLYVDDSITLSSKDLMDNSLGQVTETVFFSFTNLHQILQGAAIRLRPNDSTTAELQVNSKIISASMGRAGRHTQLFKPVKISLRHLNENMTDPVCVFWDLEDHGWSNVGCEVVTTNSSVTVCQCDHLTSFALLMRPKVTSSLATFFNNLSSRLDVILPVLAACLVFATVIIMVKVSCSCSSICLFSEEFIILILSQTAINVTQHPLGRVTLRQFRSYRSKVDVD